MSEVWKPLIFCDCYTVSNKGRIWHRYHRRMLSPRPNPTTGYVQVKISDFRNNLRRLYFVHRCVLETFVERPSLKHECNHKDRNPSNNNLSNLEWVTKSQNIQHSRSPTIHESVALSIRKRLLELGGRYGVMARVAREFKVNYRIVSNINYGNTWKHLNPDQKGNLKMKIETYPVRSKSQDLGEARYPVFDSLNEAVEGTKESIGETKCLELLNSQIKTNSMNALRTQSTKGSTKAVLRVQAQSEIVTEMCTDGLHPEAVGDAAAIERLVAARMDKIAEDQKAEPVIAE